MKTHLYNVGQECFINENGLRDMPDDVGRKAIVVELRGSGHYDYDVLIGKNKAITFVKEEELTPLTPEMNPQGLEEGMLVTTFEGVGRIYKLDFLYKKVGVKTEDGDTFTVDFDRVRPFEEGEYEIINSKIQEKDFDTLTIGEQHRIITNEIQDICVRKNKDYKNSFSDTWDEFGIISLAIRLNDKMLRLKQLSKNDAMVKDESIEDTLRDMANYCILGLIEMRKRS